MVGETTLEDLHTFQMAAPFERYPWEQPITRLQGSSRRETTPRVCPPLGFNILRPSPLLRQRFTNLQVQASQGHTAPTEHTQVIAAHSKTNLHAVPSPSPKVKNDVDHANTRIPHWDNPERRNIHRARSQRIASHRRTA